MYKNPRQKKTERFKLSLSEAELELLDVAAEIDGGQRAVIAREILLDWARSVVEKARLIHGRASFGVVGDDGQIKYRFA
jgi:uncharacterized protein (DUF1778 family)